MRYISGVGAHIILLGFTGLVLVGYILEIELLLVFSFLYLVISTTFVGVDLGSGENKTYSGVLERIRFRSPKVDSYVIRNSAGEIRKFSISPYNYKVAPDVGSNVTVNYKIGKFLKSSYIVDSIENVP